MLEKFNVSFFLILSFFCILFSSNVLFAREKFEFNLGQKVNILSDKAFRKSSENEFEAIGNVVITHMKNSIYGEKAKINFTTGDAEIIGNVRYIAPEITLYGTKLKYNFITRQIDLVNARVLSENFVVTGKRIIQTTPELIYAEDAEYTTCRDCPESWSVFGRNITVDIGNYVKIKHAFIKINGVIAMYFPYIVFPIKQKRESGLLFPLLGFRSNEGFRYQQPFFWAIDDYKDVTLTPSAFGNRGFGGELQFRQNFKEKTWIEVNTLQLNDKVYEPYKTSLEKSGDQYYRHFSDLEFHFIRNQDFNGHIYANNTSDLDTPRDLDFFTKDKIRGTEVGGGGFIEKRSSLFSLTAESYFNKNMLIKDPRQFDDRYVQMLPKLTLATVPISVIHSDYPLAKNISFGLNSDYTIFKQNKADMNGPIRNARRLNLAPYMNWQLGNIGPLFFSHKLKLDYQTYNFPKETEKTFSKKGLIYETEAKLELERIFGLSFLEERKMNPEIEVQKNSLPQTTIGSLPSLKNNKDDVIETLSHSSYRHSQEYKIKHYYLSDQKFSGSSKFKNQIESDDGQFDYIDAIRSKEYLTNQVTAQDSLPLSNTVEFQWNNRLIRKSAKVFDPYIDGRYLKDNFYYSNIAFFDLSQGLDMNVNSDQLVNRLTRLYLNTGLSLDKVSLNLQEFYFHKTAESKLTSTATYTFEKASLGGRFTYNSFNSSSTAVAKLAGYDLVLQVSDLVLLKNSLDYNLSTKNITQSSYSLVYSPLNNCWKVEFNYARDLIDQRFGLLLYINYNENNFAALNVR